VAQVACQPVCGAQEACCSLSVRSELDGLLSFHDRVCKQTRPPCGRVERTIAPDSKIGWTDRAQNFWRACLKVIEECHYLLYLGIMRRGGYEAEFLCVVGTRCRVLSLRQQAGRLYAPSTRDEISCRGTARPRGQGTVPCSYWSRRDIISVFYFGKAVIQGIVDGDSGRGIADWNSAPSGGAIGRSCSYLQASTGYLSGSTGRVAPPGSRLPSTRTI